MGTRKITEYGINNCKLFSKEFALRDIPVVSGMALGTDSVAHETAINFDGKTIAVLGSGFANIFPKENIKLFEEIIRKGNLVITEFEKNVKPNKENFPKRNRIITGISEGVLVIEAAYRSGTSITVNNAKKQGKKVFAIPGRIDSYVGVGVNNMIKKGAILTTDIKDILEYYPKFLERNKRKKDFTFLKISEMKKDYLKILELFNDKHKNLEDILDKSIFDFKETIKILTQMEIEGIITKNFLGEYEISNKYKEGDSN